MYNLIKSYKTLYDITLSSKYIRRYFTISSHNNKYKYTIYKDSLYKQIKEALGKPQNFIKSNKNKR